MLIAAHTPLAETQQMCVLWLEGYFEKYGDQAPNRDETHLQIMQKMDLYEQYVRDTIRQSGQDGRVVPYSRFIILSATVFPSCITRPWCDIPGKCDICYRIDKLRRTSEDAIVQEKLKECHHLHRAGMFMLERNE